MANGLQGRSKPNASTDTTLFTATTPIVVALNIVNLSGGTANTIRVYLVPSGASAANEHLIENDTDLVAKGVIERTGIVLGTGDSIVVYSNNNTSVFNCWGVEL